MPQFHLICFSLATILVTYTCIHIVYLTMYCIHTTVLDEGFSLPFLSDAHCYADRNHHTAQKYTSTNARNCYNETCF